MIYSIIYFLVGLILTWYWWNKDYANEYNTAKINNNVEDSMVPIFLMFLIIFWPIKFIFDIIFKLFCNK